MLIVCAVLLAEVVTRALSVVRVDLSVLRQGHPGSAPLCRGLFLASYADLLNSMISSVSHIVAGDGLQTDGVSNLFSEGDLRKRSAKL